MNADWGSIASLASTVVVALATLALAWLTRGYVKLTAQMVAQMKASRDPVVVVDFESYERYMSLCVRNIGGSPAKNVRFVLTDTVPWKEAELAPGRLQVLREGIAYLPPGRILKYEVSTIDWTRFREQGGSIAIAVTFSDDSGVDFARSMKIDLASYREVLYASFDPPASGVLTVDVLEAARRKRAASAEHTKDS